MKKILLTGSNGFIGRHVLHSLIKKEYPVLTPVREKSSLHNINSNNNIKIISGNFYGDEPLNEYKNYKPDTIIHLAAIRGDGGGTKEDYYKVNVLGTQKLVDFALLNNTRLFIFFSSVGIYGTIPVQLPADNSTAPSPDGYYHQSKFEAENLVVNKLKGKIPYVILRPTITYGEGDNGFLPRLISLVKKRIFPLSTNPLKIHLLNVQSIGKIILRILETDTAHNGIFNLADCEPALLSKIVNLVHQHFYNKPYPGFLKISPVFFKVGEKLTELLNLRQYEISLKLISNSWYYDVSHLEQAFSLQLTDTLKSIKELLEKEYY